MLALIVLAPGPRSHRLFVPADVDTQVVARLSTCVRRLRQPDDGEPPWLAVYGDSLSRAVFFDTVEALNGSAATAPDQVHPGHQANYSVDCTVLEARPPTRRPKCGGFAFDWWWPPTGAAASNGRAAAVAAGQRVGPVRLPGGGDDTSPALVGPAATAASARLSFRLKTFGWEPEYDDAWLRALRRAPRLPDALLLSFGIWDMQYPPEDAPARGREAFAGALRRFLAALERALSPAPPRAHDDAPLTAASDATDAAAAAAAGDRRGGGSGRRRRPRLFWLSVTAVADAQLPAWKRPRMSGALARAYNELARPELARHGITYVDTHTSGAAHPELSVDGVHFGGALSRHHAHLFWDALCAGAA